MQIRPIKTKADHRAALKEIERLMHAKPGTPAGDRLEVLTTLVDRYESEHEPIDPPDPIDALLYHMESRGLTRRDLEPFSEAEHESSRFLIGVARSPLR
jgi:HTH-type transcriptional regulator/antitoxin HigA